MVAKWPATPSTESLAQSLASQFEGNCRTNRSTEHPLHHLHNLVANLLWGWKLWVGLVPPLIIGDLIPPVVVVEYRSRCYKEENCLKDRHAKPGDEKGTPSLADFTQHPDIVLPN